MDYQDVGPSKLKVTQERDKTNDGDDLDLVDESSEQDSTQTSSAGRILTAKDWIMRGIKLEEEL